MPLVLFPFHFNSSKNTIMLRKTTSLYVSECIINILQNGVQTNINHIDGLIEAYQNGREHGHIIFGLSQELSEIAFNIDPRNAKLIEIREAIKRGEEVLFLPKKNHPTGLLQLIKK